MSGRHPFVGFPTREKAPSAGIGGIGTGVADSLAKWTGPNTIGISSITDDGTNVTAAMSGKFIVTGGDKIRIGLTGDVQSGVTEVLSAQQNIDGNMFIAYQNMSAGTSALVNWRLQTADGNHTLNLGLFGTNHSTLANTATITTGPNITGGILIGPSSAAPLKFQTNNLERARLLAGGQLLLGATAQAASETFRSTQSADSLAQLGRFDNTSGGTSARANIQVLNDIGSGLAIQVSGSNHATTPNELELISTVLADFAIRQNGTNRSFKITGSSDANTFWESVFDGTNTKIGLHGVTPVVRAAAVTDIKDALTSIGILQGTSASPLNLDGGNLTGGIIQGTAIGGGSAAGLRSVSTSPGIEVRETGAALNEKSWDFLANSGSLLGRAVNDANSAASTWLQVERTGVTVDSVAFPILSAGRVETDSGGVLRAESPVGLRAKQSVGSLALGTSFAAVTGASLTLTVPGTYRIAFYARGQVDAPSKFCVYRIFNVTAAAAVADSEAISGFDNVTAVMTDSQNSCAMEAFITITASTTVRLEAKGSSATGCNSVDDANGRTLITAQRI